ncbi:MAG TPA: GIY-YIG nuclease family protein [Candidatus Paceibacterota bacterium]
MKNTVVTAIKKAPKTPGVYLFYSGSQLLYIGKAANLRARLKNYLKPADYKTKSLDQEATKLKLVILRSNIEALITESKLIKALKPKYNILWQDDKNYFYVAITKDRFPRLFITHQPNDEMDIIGPFTDGNALKAVMRLLRRYFPYCTCVPHLRVCLNAQINNCPGYCCNKNAQPTPSQISAYKKTIRRISNVLSGQDKRFLKTLKDPYELVILDKIFAHQPYLETSKNIFSDIQRIECYDNSHLSGKEAVGAMTVLSKQDNGTWQPDVNEWRKFKIIGNYTEDDPRMMAEIVSRRLNHPEWRYPDIIIIDGGITQYRAARKSFRTHNIKNIKLFSFAKPQQLVFGFNPQPTPLSKLPPEWQQLIPKIISQTHNFVIRYHRRTRNRQFLTNR